MVRLFLNQNFKSPKQISTSNEKSDFFLFVSKRSRVSSKRVTVSSKRVKKEKKVTSRFNPSEGCV